MEAGNDTEIQVAIDRDGLPAGADESAFAISDGVNKYIVTIQFMEPEYTDGKIKLLTSTLDFGTEAAKLDLKVENVGTTYLSWTISDIPDYITCYPTYKQGMKSIAITPIELNRATMPDKVDTFIIITNDYNPSDTYKVRITATKQNTSASSGSKIYYTSTDGNVVTPYKASAFGANIVSNVYENGQGVITFDGKITTIGENAFKQRNTLATITIPDGTTSIGDSAFESCVGLTEVIIPEGVTSIGGIAFFYCKTLSEITLPSTVSAIGDKAFAMCQGIANLYCKATTPPELEGYFTQTFPMSNVIDENIFVIWVPREAHSIYTTNSDWNVDYKEGVPTYNAEQLQPYDF